MGNKLKAPFVYFGGKSRVAALIWDRLGDVDNFVEPFAGSAAVLLARPHLPRIETLNDRDCYVSNFWRATAHDPEGVVDFCDDPVSECDLHARHRWLVLSGAAKAFREKMRADPDYYSVRIAGWWVWGINMWIGSGWCVEPDATESLTLQRPQLDGSADGKVSNGGVHGTPPLEYRDANRPQLADAFSRGPGVHGNDAAGTCAQRRAWLLDWFGKLRDRLRTVRVCCGDWRRVCDSDSVLTRLGTTGVFLDPPYGEAAGRASNLYSTDSLTVAADVRAWGLEHGVNPQMRIALAGYEGEGHEELEAQGWKVEAWRANGGYGNRKGENKNRDRERIWFSPFCRNQRGLFDNME